MAKELCAIITNEREAIATNWAMRAQQTSKGYQNIPLDEIKISVLKYVDALNEAITSANYEPIEHFLRDIAKQRIAAGFFAKDIERVVIMGCDVILPFLEQAYAHDARRLVFSITQIERVIHRSIDLLGRIIHEMELEQAQAIVLGMENTQDTIELRIQAVLNALSQGAIVVNTAGIVIWTDKIAGSSRCGLIHTGDSVFSSSGSGPDLGLIRKALESGQVEYSACNADCEVCFAVPVKDDTGKLIEVIGILGPGLHDFQKDA